MGIYERRGRQHRPGGPEYATGRCRERCYRLEGAPPGPGELSLHPSRHAGPGYQAGVGHDQIHAAGETLALFDPFRAVLPARSSPEIIDCQPELIRETRQFQHIPVAERLAAAPIHHFQDPHGLRSCANRNGHE